MQRISKLTLAAAAVSGLFLLAPMLVIAPMSFSTSKTFEFPPPGYWLGYYQAFFNSSAWGMTTWNSFIVAVGTAAVTMVLAVPAAYAYVRLRFRGRGAVNFLMMFPLVVPQVVSALAFYIFLGQVGLSGSHVGLVLAHVTIAVPVAFLTVSAAFKGFDINLERAAMSSGAGPIRTFLLVTLPVVRPGIIIGGLFAFVQSFNEAVIAIFIAGRDAETLPKKMFESVRMETDPIIAVVSTLLVFAALASVGLGLAFKRSRG
jgi:putative spermidine/putrescine transport system permease protein